MRQCYSIQGNGARAGILLNDNMVLGAQIARSHFDHFRESGVDSRSQEFGLLGRYYFPEEGY